MICARMQRVRRDEEHGVDVRVREQLARSPCTAPLTPSSSRAQSSSSPIGLHAATSSAPGTRVREILGVAAAHAAEAGDADANGDVQWLVDSRRPHSSTIRFSRHDVVAASASSSALTPSSIDVRTGLPLASASKKCAISSA